MLLSSDLSRSRTRLLLQWYCTYIVRMGSNIIPWWNPRYEKSLPKKYRKIIALPLELFKRVVLAASMVLVDLLEQIEDGSV